METIVLIGLAFFVGSVLSALVTFFWTRNAYEEELLYQLQNALYWQKTFADYVDRKEGPDDVL
jgi:hypothetical protein